MKPTNWKREIWIVLALLVALLAGEAALSSLAEAGFIRL